LQEFGAADQVTALLARDPATQVSLKNSNPVAQLLTALKKAGTEAQVAALLARDPATHVTLEHAGSLAKLLNALRDAGAREQVTTLLARNPAVHVTVNDATIKYTLKNLIDALREAGAEEQAIDLEDDALDQLNGGPQYRQQRTFGREATGSFAKPWSWDDLD
jgi:uncharacterized protein YidB (DUF937 family)